MRRTIISVALLTLTGAGLALPLTASADPGETVSISYSIDANYQLTATAHSSAKPGEGFDITVLPLSGGLDNAQPAAFLIEAVGNGGEIFDQVFDRFHRVVVCPNNNDGHGGSCTASPTVVNVP